MKKFLTVLLALSVVFTYTVGTAFAVVPDADTQYTQAQAEQLLSDAQTAVQADIDLALQNVIKAYDSTKFSSHDSISKADVVKYVTDKAEELKTAVATEKAKQLQSLRGAIAALGDTFLYCTTSTAGNLDPGYVALGTYTDAIKGVTGVSGFEATYKAKVSNDIGAANGFTADEAKAIGQAGFKALKDATIAAIKAIDLSVYSTEIEQGEWQSNRDKAQAAVTEALNDVSAISITSSSDLADCDKQAQAIKDVFVKGEQQAPNTGTLAAALAAIKTIAESGTDVTKLEYAKKAVIAEIEKQIAAAKAAAIKTQNDIIITEQLKDKPNATTIANAKKAIEDAEADYAALLEILKYRVNATKAAQLADLGSFTGAAFTLAAKWNNVLTVLNAGGAADSITLANAIKDKIATLKAKAELLKNTVDLTGATAADIDKQLEEAIQKAYLAADAAALVNIDIVGYTELTKVFRRQAELIGTAVNTVTVNYRSYANVFSWTAVATLANYKDDQYAAIRAIAAKAEKEINAASTVEAAEGAFVAAYNEFDAIVTSAEHDALFTTGALKDNYGKYKAELEAYVTYKLGLMDASENTYTAATIKTTVDDMLKEAYTAAELDAKYAQAKAFIDGLKTKTQLTAEAKNITNQVLAINGAVTVSDKAAVAAAKKAVEDYNQYLTDTGSTVAPLDTTLVNGYSNTIRAAEAKAINDAYALLKAKLDKNTLGADDAAAVKALREAKDAFIEYYYGEANAVAQTPTVDVPGGPTEAAIVDLEDAVAGYNVTAVVNMIAKLPASVKNTAENTAVKNAKAAYDALTDAEKKDILVNHYDAYTKLVVCLGYSDTYIKDGVKNTTIKIYSKAYKKYTKISWTKSLGFKVDGYEVYRATKKNGKYTKIWTAKSTGKSVKNTKNLISGKKYYYYVKGFRMIDGEKVYTKKSITIYRTAK